MTIADFLASVDPFDALPPPSLARLAEKVVVREFAAGQTIVRRGDPGDAMYVIESGTVRVPIVDEGGRTKFTADLGPGEFFGEMALLTGEPRTADVIAAEAVRCLGLYRSDLDPFLAENPAVARFLTDILGKRLMEIGAIRQVGKYHLLGTLGRGGAAIVFEGHHPTLGRPVAIKMLGHHLIYDGTFRKRFNNEARIIAGLRHENIVGVFDTEEAYATCFIIMEKVEGIGLSDLISSRGAIPPDQVRDILRQVAGALDYAGARGIVHRDLKPSNLIIEPGGRVRLMDFGIASEPTLEDAVREEGYILGTPEYMAPEQILGQPVDGRTDIYSLGVLAYKMLTGRIPFEDEDDIEILKKHLDVDVPSPRLAAGRVPDDLEEFVRRATAKRPVDRFQTGAEVVEFLTPDRSLPFDADRLAVRTLTLLYDRRRAPAVDALVDEFTERLAAVEGVRLAETDPIP